MITILLFALWDYSYHINADFIYDNNIFNYSGKNIDDFLNNHLSYRFPFETYDDLITSTSLNFYLRNKFFNKKTTTFNFDVNLNHYWVNAQKDFQKISIGIRQSLRRYAIKVWYRLIPNYLLRYYQDPTTKEKNYIGFKLKYHSLCGKFTARLNPVFTAYLIYKRGWDDYTTEFNQYDAGHHTFSASLDIGTKTVYEFSYAFKTLRTIQEINNEDNLDEPDGAYEQHTISGAINFSRKFFFPMNVRLVYKFKNRIFVTNIANDLIHYGRQDHIQKIFFRINFKLFPGVVLKTNYAYQWRRSSTPLLIDIAQLKDYNKHRFGIGLSIFH